MYAFGVYSSRQTAYAPSMSVYACTFRGTIDSGTIGEIFSHSLGIESSASPAAVAQALHDEWVTLWGTAATGLGTFFTPQIEYTEATAAQVLDPMVPDLGAAAHSAFTPPLAGRAVGDMLPSQCAVAISLTAGTRPDGRPFRGRFYLPNPHEEALDLDGLLPTATTSNLATMFKDFFDRLNAAGHYVSVWSRTTEDLVNPVSLVRVGNRVDTIRSRRNRYPEVYSSQAVAGPA